MLAKAAAHSDRGEGGGGGPQSLCSHVSIQHVPTTSLTSYFLKNFLSIEPTISRLLSRVSLLNIVWDVPCMWVASTPSRRGMMCSIVA
jgi:hypothetical protein